MAPDPDSFQTGQIVTVFRSRTTASAGDEYARTAEDILERARRQPGFVDFKSFAADDGEHVSLITFEDEASQAAWHQQADHRRAQAAGRDRFYETYQIQVCRCLEVSHFDAG
jgi:heme-degrading monooxygenase HmoA